MQPLPQKLGRENQPNALSKNPSQIVSKVVGLTSFRIKKEIYRNWDTVSGKYYLRSLIYDGTYNGMHSVLKLHGTKGTSRDAEEIQKFESQNKSKTIRAPFVYANEKWNKRAGYGFTIFEYIKAPEIFNRPFPTDTQLRRFVAFYQEYRTKAITTPWIKRPKTSKNSISDMIFNYTQEWLKNTKLKKRLTESDYSSYLTRFYSLVPKYISLFQIEFMHMHLYPEHVRRFPNGTYVLLDHMSWGYRLRWADLSYMLWRSVLDMKDNNITFDKLLSYVNNWINICKKIPLTSHDKNFDKKIRFLILERTIGIIVGDLGFGNYWGTAEGKKHFKHMLSINQKLFNHISDEL